MSLDVGWGPGGQSGGENPFDFVLPDKDETTTSWRWATVVSSSPLRVTLDGDDSPLLATPWDMGSPAPRIPGDRVYCQINARRVVILGPNGGGGGGKATYIGAAIGTIQIWSGPLADIPQGWLLCDGRAVSRTTYASLHSIIASAYGAGDGSTTFNIPDLRGRVPAGQGGTAFAELGAKGGEETVTLTTAQMPAHAHRQLDGTGEYNISLGGGSPISDPSYVNASTPFAPEQRGTGNAGQGGIRAVIRWESSLTGSGQAHNNLQPFLTVRYIIKAQMLASEVQGLDATVRNLEVTGTTTGVHRATELGANVNLNDIGAPGAYAQRVNINASTALNYPVAEAGLLEVFNTTESPTENMIHQRYTQWGAADGTAIRVYHRRYYATGGGWGPWNFIGGDLRGALSLASGWDDYGGSASPVSQLVRQDRTVTLTGGLLRATVTKSITGAPVQFATIPPGFRPNAEAHSFGRAFSAPASHFQLYFYPDGRASILSNPNTTLSLDQYVIIPTTIWTIQ